MPFLFRWSLRLFKQDSSMLECWTKPHPFWLQKVLKILLQSVTFFVSESSSSLVVSDEIVNWVSGDLEVIMFPRSTIFSATARGEVELLRSFVPVWRIIILGFSSTHVWRLCFMSVFVAPGKLLTVTRLFAARLNKSLRNPLMIECPMIIVSSFDLDLCVSCWLTLAFLPLFCGSWAWAFFFFFPWLDILGLWWVRMAFRPNSLPVIRRFMVLCCYILICWKDSYRFH